LCYYCKVERLGAPLTQAFGALIAKILTPPLLRDGENKRQIRPKERKSDKMEGLI
jgi:hypothetical protein